MRTFLKFPYPQFGVGVCGPFEDLEVCTCLFISWKSFFFFMFRFKNNILNVTPESFISNLFISCLLVCPSWLLWSSCHSPEVMSPLPPTLPLRLMLSFSCWATCEPHCPRRLVMCNAIPRVRLCVREFPADDPLCESRPEHRLFGRCFGWRDL